MYPFGLRLRCRVHGSSGWMMTPGSPLHHRTGWPPVGKRHRLVMVVGAHVLGCSHSLASRLQGGHGAIPLAKGILRLALWMGRPALRLHMPRLLACGTRSSIRPMRGFALETWASWIGGDICCKGLSLPGAESRDVTHRPTVIALPCVLWSTIHPWTQPVPKISGGSLFYRSICPWWWQWWVLVLGGVPGVDG